MTTPPTRAAAIDAVRVFGIVAIVVGHVWSTTQITRLVYPWHVPIFFFLTGYLWTTGRSVNMEVRSRSRSLLVPYVSWLIIIGFAYVGYRTATGTSLNVAMIGKVVYGGSFATRPFSTFWFVTALFFAAVFARILEGVGHGAPWMAAALGLAACAVAGEKIARSPLAIGVAVPCMAFILAGISFRLLRQRVTRALPVGAALIAISLSLVFAGISRPLDLKHGDFGVPVVGALVATMISAGLVLVFESVCQRLDGFIVTAITRLAQAGLVVVLTHAVILWILNTPSTGSYIALALCLTCPWILGLLVIRSPLSWLLAGQPLGSDLLASSGSRGHLSVRSKQ
jgi:acyltransferase